jgi:hypothetical protein
VKSIAVDNPQADTPQAHTKNSEILLLEIAQLMKEFHASRKYKDSIGQAITSLLSDFTTYSKAFGVKQTSLCNTARVTLVGAVTGDWTEPEADRTARLAREATSQAGKVARAQARAEAEMEKSAGILGRWIAGENVRPPHSHGALARLRVVDDRVETSQGARVTVRAALRLLAYIHSTRHLWKAGQYEPAESVGVDGFNLRSISPEGIVEIGCHRITVDEMERVAPACRLASKLATA